MTNHNEHLAALDVALTRVAKEVSDGGWAKESDVSQFTAARLMVEHVDERTRELRALLRFTLEYLQPRVANLGDIAEGESLDDSKDVEALARWALAQLPKVDVAAVRARARAEVPELLEREAHEQWLADRDAQRWAQMSEAERERCNEFHRRISASRCDGAG